MEKEENNPPKENPLNQQTKETHQQNDKNLTDTKTATAEPIDEVIGESDATHITPLPSTPITPSPTTSEHLTSTTAQELDQLDQTENLKKIEAALFLSARYLTIQELIMLTDINPLMLRELLEKLTNQYSQNTSSIQIVNKKNKYKMDVKEEYIGLINKLATGNVEFTKAEQETLAVLAYKQPVKQSVIINIRGNKAYEHIKHFIETGLVIAKRIGHTKELKLSDNFFDYFHLQKKADGTSEIVPEDDDENEDE